MNKELPVAEILCLFKRRGKGDPGGGYPCMQGDRGIWTFPRKTGRRHPHTLQCRTACHKQVRDGDRADLSRGRSADINFHVFADETRPLLQGARLTAFELQSSGVDVTLICDNMSSSVMQKGWVNAVFVGCDRVAANGDTANKIGTSVVAAVADHYKVPVYICAPTSTIDMDTKTGSGYKDRGAPGGRSDRDVVQRAHGTGRRESLQSGV